MLVGGELGVGVGKEVVVLGNTVVGRRPQPRHHDVARDPGADGGIHRADRRVAVDRLHALVETGEALVPLSLEEMKRRMDTENYTDEELKAYYENHNALSLIEQVSEEDKGAVRWYIDCGDDDFLYEGNSLVHIAMKKQEIPHEFRIRDGGHTWTYWRKSLPSVLKFVTQAFHQY